MLIFSFSLNKKELAIMSPKENSHEATFPEAVIPEELQSNILVDFNSISFPFPNHNVREKLKGSAITSRNIDNLGIGSVYLYGGNTVSYREVKKDVDLSDFYEATSVEFTKLSSDKSVFSFWEGLKSDKDLKWHHSPLSNSEYLVNHHTGDIYRFSDHWGKVASCEWSLNDEPIEGWSIGVANIQSFKSLPFSRSLVLKSSFVNQLNQVIANLQDIIDSKDIRKTDSALRTLNKRLDDLKSHKASLNDWKVYVENANLIKSKDISDMAYKKTNASSSGSSSYSDAVIQQFADMMIKRMEDMKESYWKKGWMDGRGDAGFPRNALTGRQYNGINPFMLMYDTIEHEYTTSMYLTARQLFSMNETLKDSSTGKIALENLDKVMKINKGEKAFPVYYMIHKYKDMQGKEYSDQEYNDLSEEDRKDIKAYFYPKIHHLFNIDQTNMKEVNPSLYNSFVDKYTKRPSLPDSEGMYVNEDIDSLLAHSKPSVWKSGKDNLSWYCPIDQTANISSPHYNLSKDFIKVPLKNQYKTSDSKEGIFADGQAFYATLLHEMAHSTGSKERLNRDLNNTFGDKKYAKEELVAELSAALISSTMGFDKRINDNNAKYVSSWLKVLREDPSFIKSVLSDVGKASDMITEKIDAQQVSLRQTQVNESNVSGLVEERGEEKRHSSEISSTEVSQVETPNVSMSSKTDVGISLSESMPKVDLQLQWENIKKQLNTVPKEEKQSANYDITKDISLARDYIANNFHVSGEIFDSFSNSDKERLVSLYSNYSSSLLSSFTEERKVEKEISDFILLGGLLDPENAQKVLEKGYEKMNLLRETPNVNLAVLKSSVLSLADNHHREPNSIAYGQYDIPIWAVKHLSEGKDSSLSETKLSEIGSFKSQLPNNSFFEFKESNVSYSEKPAFGPATNVIKAHIYVSRDQHQEESVSINKSVNDSEEYTMARRLPQQDSKKNEEIFYSSVASITSGEDFHLFDSMREKGHLNKMLKVAAEYDSGDAISLDTTHKSPLQNSGDEVLRENKNYAVVYNNSVGGAYEIFRKSPQSEILNSVERYGLPLTASEDVKSLSGRKDYSSDHDLYEATQHEDHDALKSAAASRGMTPKQMEESLAAGTEEKLPDSSELDKKRGLDDREKEIELKNEELSGEVSSKQELQDKNVEARRKEESQREAEKREKEKQESQKRDDSSAKIITAAFLRSSLLSTALLSAKDNNRVWLNADAKTAPSFHKASWEVSPYNQLFMSLNSDKNGYATNVYTTFKHEDSLAVKKGSESMPYSWTDWSMYKSKGPEAKSITSSQYENLSSDEKEHFMKASVKYDRKIFNIDQTVLKGANPEQYNAILKEHDTHYKEMQTIASTESVDLVSDRVSKIKKQHPDHLVLFAHNGVYNAFGKDAKTIHQLAKDSVTLDSINNSKFNRKTSIAYLKPSDLDKVIKAVVSSGQRVAVADNFEVLNAPKEATKILSKAETVLDNYSKSTGINVQKSLTQPTSYDKETDSIILNNKKPVNPGGGLRTAVENSNAIYFAISQSVANNNRLDISNQFSMPEKEIESVRQLIATVSAGVLSLKQSHPAVLSDQVSNESVESWVQDIKNDPHLLSSLERNVNNTVNTIEKLIKGEQVDYAAINGKSSYNKVESFNLVSELNEVVNTSTMSAAVIRNNDGKSASVILSKGIDSSSENGSLNNEDFRQALLKQGIKEVKFFNPGGTLGLNKGDSYFEDKSIQIVNFDGKEVVPQQELHLNERSQNVEHNFEDVSAVKDDNNRWHLYIKEKDQPYFIIQPEIRDMSRLFEAFKSKDQHVIFDTKTSLGEKYTKLVQHRPELKVDFLMPKVPAEDISRIEKANIARDAQDKNKYLIFATIDGKGYHHEISREDFRRMWKVDNMQSYKSALAAKVFSNVLHEGQTISEVSSVEENQQIKETNSEKVDSPKQSTESEENLSPRVGRSH